MTTKKSRLPILFILTFKGMLSVWNHCWFKCTYLTVLDPIIVHILGSGSVFANILILGELIDKNFASVPAIRLWETVLGLGLLHGKGQFSEGSMRLFTIKCLCQCSQIYNTQCRAVKLVCFASGSSQISRFLLNYSKNDATKQQKIDSYCAMQAVRDSQNIKKFEKSMNRWV